MNFNFNTMHPDYKAGAAKHFGNMRKATQYFDNYNRLAKPQALVEREEQERLRQQQRVAQIQAEYKQNKFGDKQNKFGDKAILAERKQNKFGDKPGMATGPRRYKTASGSTYISPKEAAFRRRVEQLERERKASLARRPMRRNNEIEMQRMKAGMMNRFGGGFK